ncbi:MAG: polysulfide reductase NrfD [Chloroflexi bacterium]|nr:polysulfide reductase NrfD [Chloroflexota bacterium]
MQERVAMGGNLQEVEQKVNRDLLISVTGSVPRRFWVAVALMALLAAAGFGAAGYVVAQGLGATGLNRPIMWAFFITNFVFWIGISHAGVMLSAILRLAQAEWRRPATRAAEIVTIFSLVNAMLFPIIHTGRPWRTLYWAFPYDFGRGIWPNVRSPLIWDPSAIITYLTSSVLFVYVALIPDIAVARDRTTGIRHQFYSVLALGWRGYPRQWRLQIIAGFLLSALILPIFVSVHSIVSWDFAVNQSVEGWHSTIFAPYFVIGAVHSGVSAVVTVMIILRFLFKWEDYIRPEHMDALGRLLIVVAITWFYFFAMEVTFGLFTLENAELGLRSMQFFETPYSTLFLVFIIAAFFFPVPMWMFKNVRRSFFWMTITTISVNIGMWLERFLIIIPGLARKQPLSFSWSTYAPSVPEILMVVGSFGFVGMSILLFAKVFPLIPIYDVKEGEILRREMKIGKVTIPAVLREE